MANLNKINEELDASQARNGGIDGTPRFGYVTELEIGGTKINVGIKTAFDPIEKKNAASAVVILDAFSWAGTPESPMWLAGEVRLPTRDQIEELIQGKLDKHNVTAKFAIFHYSQKKGHEGYYKYFDSQEVKAKLVINDGTLSIGVGKDPVNQDWYRFQVEIWPEIGTKNELKLQSSPQVNNVLQWGNE
jgi:hypothetical protein